MLQWESIDRLKMEFVNWLMVKQGEIQKIEQQPVKLHVEAAEAEIQQLQAIREEVMQKEATIEKIRIKYTRYGGHLLFDDQKVENLEIIVIMRFI